MKLTTARYKLKTILKDNMNRRSIISKKGTINANRLHAHSTSDRIFSKRLENSGKVYNLEILFDASGSMGHWHGRNEDSAFYRGISIVQSLVKLFDGVIDINTTFYNLREWKLTKKQILKFDMSKIKTTNDQFNYMGTSNMSITPENHIVEGGTRYDGAEGNWEICNIQNAFERISKKKGEKIIIIIGDGAMRCDSFTNDRLIEDNYYIAGKSCKKYNPRTAKETCLHIEKNGVKMLGVALGSKADFSYISNNTRIRSASEIYEIAFNFLKKSLK